MNSNTALRLAFAAAATLAAGCASQPLPESELAAAKASIAAASAVAPARDLERAQVKLALGERWIAAGDYGPARWLAEQAEVDAELAAARAASEAARSASLAERAAAGFVRTSLQR